MFQKQLHVQFYSKVGKPFLQRGVALMHYKVGQVLIQNGPAFLYNKAGQLVVQIRADIRN